MIVRDRRLGIRVALWAAVLLLSVQGGTGALAQGVGLVDTTEVLVRAKAAQSVRVQIEAQRADYQAAIDRFQQELRDENEKLARQRTVLSAEAFEQRRQELERSFQEARQKAQVDQRAFQEAFRNSMRAVSAKAEELVRVIAKERGLDLVVRSDVLLYAKDPVNLTQDLILRLDKSLPDIKVPKIAQ